MDLWLPVIVSALAVFVASFVVWTVLPHHKKDMKVLPDEKAWTECLSKLSIPPGIYMWPGCGSSEEMKSEEYKARYAAGPWGSVNIMRAKPNFGRNLVLVFLVYLVISIFVGYITGLARPAGAESLAVFRVAGAVAVLGYCAGALPGAIFMGKPGRFVLTDFLDSLAYGLLTGLIFGWLWPAAAVTVGA
jgi:hypothetical protein